MELEECNLEPTAEEMDEINEVEEEIAEEELEYYDEKMNNRMMNNALNAVFERTKEYQKRVLTAEDEVMLVKKWKEEGDRTAYETMYYSNLRLVYSYVHRRYRYGTSMSLEDLFNEGCIGLDTAIQKFDYTLGYKFSTYAIYWIKQCVSRNLLDKCSIIRVPVHTREELIRIHKISNELEMELHREPTLEEIEKRSSIPVERIKFLLHGDLVNQTTSLNKTVNNHDTDTELGDLLYLADKHDPENIIEEETNRLAVENMLSVLREKERFVLIHRYGLYGHEEKTLAEVGEMLHVTRERVRQIEMQGLRKIRQASGFMSDFLEHERTGVPVNHDKILDYYTRKSGNKRMIKNKKSR